MLRWMRGHTRQDRIRIHRRESCGGSGTYYGKEGKAFVLGGLSMCGENMLKPQWQLRRANQTKGSPIARG